MMDTRGMGRLAFLLALIVCCEFFWGCSARRTTGLPDYSPPDTECTERVVTEAELERWAELDSELTVRACCQILARLNIRDRLHILDDIKLAKPLRVPNDFRAYKSWTPMPPHIPQVANARKFILVVKDIPFIGWYEKGRLVRDTHVCIGKKEGWTKAGLYAVRGKDENHISRSYKNALGEPAPMPYALRIYGRVWIHAGDVEGGYGSHGCINLPLEPAQELFRWADLGTAVLVVEDLDTLEAALEKHSANIRT